MSIARAAVRVAVRRRRDRRARERFRQDTRAAIYGRPGGGGDFPAPPTPARLPGGPPLPPSEGGPLAGSRTVIHRAWAGPVWGAVLVAALSVAGWAAGTIPARLTVVAVVAALGGLWVWRVGRRRRKAAAALVAFGAAWAVTPVTPVEPRHWLILTLVVLAVGERRMSHFRIRPPEPVDPGPADVWAATLGDKGRPLAGSTMSDPEGEPGVQSRPVLRDGTPYGFAMAWRGVPGVHTASALVAQREHVASLYGREPDDVVIERTGDAGRALVSVFTRSPFATPRLWTPGLLDVRTGVCEVSTFPDGTRGSVQLWKPGEGVRMSALFGSTGSGKSDAANAVLGSVMGAGRVVLDLVDLGGLPAWQRVAYRYGTTVKDAEAALMRANTVLDARKIAMRTMAWKGSDGTIREGATCLDPSLEWPMYLVVIEEWPEVTRAETHLSGRVQALADRVGALGRKHGVAVLIISQGVALHIAFPKCPTLRTQVQNGNIIGLRSSKEAAGMAFGSGLEDVDLSAIPTGRPGLGFVMSPVTQRGVMSRVDWPASPCPGCGGEFAEDCEACGGSGLISDPWMVVNHARPGMPNNIDVIAVEAVEAAARPSRFTEPAADPDADDNTPTDGPTLSEDDAVLDALMADLASGREIRTGDIVKAVGGPGAFDRIKKGLARLADDPGSGVSKVRHGVWTYTPVAGEEAA